MLKRDGVLTNSEALRNDFIDSDAAVDASHRRAQRNVMIGVALATSALIGIDNQIYQADAANHAAAQAKYQGYVDEARLVGNRFVSCEIVGEPTSKPNAAQKIGTNHPLDELDVKLKVTPNHAADATLAKYRKNSTITWSTYAAGRYLVNGAVQNDKFYNTYNDQRLEHTRVDRPENDVVLYPSRHKTPTDQVAVYAFSYAEHMDIGVNREYETRVGIPCGVVAPDESTGQPAWKVVAGPQNLPALHQSQTMRMIEGEVSGSVQVG